MDKNQKSWTTIIQKVKNTLEPKSESKKLKGHIDNLDYSEIDLVNRELDEEEVRFEELLENFESTTFDTEHELLM